MSRADSIHEVVVDGILSGLDELASRESEEK